MPKKDNNELDQKPANGTPANGTTAIVERDSGDVTTYRILNRDPEDIARAMEIFHHNLRGQKLTELNLPRVKVPPQGITVWSVPGPEGDSHQETLKGILVEYTTPRVYWDKPMEPGSLTPPVCSSPDGVKGIGTPGGPCHLCPLSKFGSDPREESNGQACKEKRMLFLLTADSLLPTVIQGPSTSIRNVFDYTMGLANEETLFHHVYTELSLEKVASGGVEYGKVALRNAGSVDQEYHDRLESYREGLSNILGAQTVEVLPDAENNGLNEGENPDEGEQAAGEDKEENS